MAFYSPQPKLRKRTTTPGMSVRSGAGQNAKGTPNKMGDPSMFPGNNVQPVATQALHKRPDSGFFQWGSGQYGFQNRQGNINWDASKPLDTSRLIAAPKGINPPTRPKTAPAPWMDPQYMKESRGLEHELSLAQNDAQSQLAQMRDAYGLGETSIGRAITNRASQENASLGARGFGVSNVSGMAALERERDQRNAMRELGIDFGPTRQEEIESRISMLRNQLAEKKQILGSEARKRFEAYNKVLEAAGETPQSIEVDKGFKKKGSTWFYTNKNGVTISLGTETPEAMRKKLKEKKKNVANKAVNFNSNAVNDI